MQTTNKMKLTTERPVKGQVMTVRNIECKIIKVWPFGTVDVVSIDGKYSYRVTGLNFL